MWDVSCSNQSLFWAWLCKQSYSKVWLSERQTSTKIHSGSEGSSTTKKSWIPNKILILILKQTVSLTLRMMVECWSFCMLSITTKLLSLIISDLLSWWYLNTYLCQAKTLIPLQQVIKPRRPEQRNKSKQTSPVWFISIREPLVTLSIRRIKLASKSKE